jgi:hypothetical protein
MQCLLKWTEKRALAGAKSCASERKREEEAVERTAAADGDTAAVVSEAGATVDEVTTAGGTKAEAIGRGLQRVPTSGGGVFPGPITMRYVLCTMRYTLCDMHYVRCTI